MDLRSLYEEVILDHNRNPRNFNRRPEGTSHSAEGHNPLCGDHVSVHLRMDGEVIADVTFEGDGCAISTASASLMTEALKGKSEDDAKKLFESIHDALMTEGEDPPDTVSALGKLAVLLGVKEYPMRVKCATLPWHTLQAALKKSGEPVSTE
ncbi:MAG TPA: SUF system NifU family Fe-S cluster assembly protein [Gammaproteobacteria bacterium]